jgi:hypothetical protein
MKTANATRTFLPTVCVLAVLCGTSAVGAERRELRVYHVGNSVTDTIRYRALEQMAASKKDRYVFGRHMIPGAPLQHIWQHPEQGFKENPYGYYPTALKNYEWDVLTLQPFDRQLESKDGFGDLTMAKNFIDLALPKSPGVQVYIYQRWPKRKAVAKNDPAAGYAPLELEKQWVRKYNAGKWDGSMETRDYYERLTRALREAYPDLENPVRLVPVGDVLLELDKRAKAGKVPGLKDVNDLYTDGVHFNNVGAFIVGTTFYATMFQKDPTGADFRGYQPGGKQKIDQEITADLARAVQQAAWDVVRTRPLTGVVADEAPAAAQ